MLRDQIQMPVAIEVCEEERPEPRPTMTGEEGPGVSGWCLGMSLPNRGRARDACDEHDGATFS